MTPQLVAILEGPDGGRYGGDEYGRIFRELPDGRTLHVQARMFNNLLTVSPSLDSVYWTDGW